MNKVVTMTIQPSNLYENGQPIPISVLNGIRISANGVLVGSSMISSFDPVDINISLAEGSVYSVTATQLIVDNGTLRESAISAAVEIDLDDEPPVQPGEKSEPPTIDDYIIN